jgi:hypothetical protein
MKYLLFLLLVLLPFPIHSKSFPRPTEQELEYNQLKRVTYEFGGGRFGDQLMCYIHAKWISYYYGIPLIYEPFSFSNRLALHYAEYSSIEHGRTLRRVRPDPGMEINYNRKELERYIIPYFPDSAWEQEKRNNEWYSFSVDWEDPEFKKELQQMIRPLYISPYLQIPSDRVSIALHVREGGGFDGEAPWRWHPLKFPPQSYYIEQVRKISKLFPGQPLYVYVFTDHQQPLELVQEYIRNLSDLDIKFDCRATDNNHAKNILEDFFEMTRFDCLVIADSNFSIIPSKIADYKVVIRPADFQWIDKHSIYINRVDTKIAPNYLDRTKSNHEFLGSL